MNDDVIKLLEDYSTLSESIIKLLSKNIDEADYSNIDDLVTKRQFIINKLQSYNKEDIKECIKKLNLLDDELKINELFNSRRSELKSKMKELSLGKSANNMYNQEFYSTFRLFYERA